jgi:hypothetical protein
LIVKSYPVIIFQWNLYHSNPLIETNQMVVKSSFYVQYWRRSTCLKNNIQIILYIYIINCKTLTSDYISIKFIPLESSHWDESNSGKIIFLRSILTEIDVFIYITIIDCKIIFLRSTLTEINIFIYITIIDCKIIFSDHISMKFIPLESSYWDESNGGKIIFLRSILMEIDMFKNNIQIILYIYLCNNYWL